MVLNPKEGVDVPADDRLGMPLGDFLAPVPAETAWLRTEDYVGQAIVTIPLPCNWKTGIDAFSETYHVQGIHRQPIPDREKNERRDKRRGDHRQRHRQHGAPAVGQLHRAHDETKHGRRR